MTLGDPERLLRILLHYTRVFFGTNHAHLNEDRPILSAVKI